MSIQFVSISESQGKAIEITSMSIDHINPSAGCQEWHLLQLFRNNRGTALCVKYIVSEVGLLNPSTAISKLRKKGWNIKNHQYTATSSMSGLKERRSFYTLLTSEQRDLPIEIPEPRDT